MRTTLTVIKRLYADNFRCLENFELALGDKPSALLLGRNGSGKSTIGAVLEILQKAARGTNRVGELVKTDDFGRGGADVPLLLEIEVELAKHRYHYRLALELPANFRELRVRDESFSVDGQSLFSRQLAGVKLNQGERDAAFNIDWHLIALPLIQERNPQDPLHLFRTWLSRLLVLAPIPSLITGDSERESLRPHRTVRDLGDWFSGLLAETPSAYSEIASYLSEVMPDLHDVKNPLVGREVRSLSVQFKHEDASLTLPFAALSDGEKCFFICAVVLAANKAYGPLFCFWDEPDNHLALSEVGHFVQALRRSFGEGGQLLVTSHNPEAIRQFSHNTTILLSRPHHLAPTRWRMVSELEPVSDLVGALVRDDLTI